MMHSQGSVTNGAAPVFPIPVAFAPRVRQSRAKEANPAKKKAAVDAVRHLAEAVILQSIEDLWSKSHRKECIEFFKGEGFKNCADLAGMKVIDRLRIIKMLRVLNPGVFKTRHQRKLKEHTTY